MKLLDMKELGIFSMYSTVMNLLGLGAKLIYRRIKTTYSFYV